MALDEIVAQHTQGFGSCTRGASTDFLLTVYISGLSNFEIRKTWDQDILHYELLVPLHVWKCGTKVMILTARIGM